MTVKCANYKFKCRFTGLRVRKCSLYISQEVTEKSRENKFIKERERLKNKFSDLCQKNIRERNKQTEDVNTKLRHEVYDMTKD